MVPQKAKLKSISEEISGKSRVSDHLQKLDYTLKIHFHKIQQKVEKSFHI